MEKLPFSKAEELMKNDSFSHFEKVSTHKHIVLSPKYIGRIKEGIIANLDAELHVSTDVLNGALIAYNNIQLKSPVGTVVDESSEIHFDIQADFIVFRPVVGSILKGVVHRIFKQHILCLVHNFFNASLHKPRHETDEWIGSSATVGQTVQVKVTRIYNNNGILSIRGDLVKIGDTSAQHSSHVQKSGNFIVSTSTSRERRKTSESLDSAYQTDTTVLNSSLDETSVSTKKKKKKRKKDKLENEDSIGGGIDIDQSLNNNSSLQESAILSMKKKKKRKKDKEETDECIMNDSNLEISLNNNSQKSSNDDDSVKTDNRLPKMSKKRKREDSRTESDIQDSESGSKVVNMDENDSSFVKTKKKKKKKKKNYQDEDI